MRHLNIYVRTNEFNLYPINDVQIGGMGVDEVRFKNYIKRLAEDPIGRGLGLGDYTDGLSPSNRAAIKFATVAGNWYDVGEDMLYDAAQAQVKKFLKLAAPAKDKVDAVLKGHHFYQYQVPNDNGSTTIRTTDLDIADYFNAPFLDDPSDKKQVAMITYHMPKGKLLRVLCMHGEGSGATLASPLGKLAKLTTEYPADIYMTAHHHKIFATKVPINGKDALMVACGSWMRGYVEDEATYAEAGLMGPLSIGAPVIHVKSTSKGFELEGRI